MRAQRLPDTAASLFSHVTAEKAETYRAIMDVFAAAKRQFRLHLRPDEVLAEAQWRDVAPGEEAVQAALDQLTEWGNLQAQADTSRVATLEDFYRRRLLYRLTPGGEAAEAGLSVFVEMLGRRGELRSTIFSRGSMRSSAWAVTCPPIPLKSMPSSAISCTSSKGLPATPRRSSRG